MNARSLFSAYGELFVALLSGTIAVLCLFVVPVWGFGPEFLVPDGRAPGTLRGASALFMLTYSVGLASSVVCLVLVVTLVFPDEWVDAD
ncbi:MULTISPECIES: hypothetical protein [Haloarcula]|uniref:hypothetical protein n=1 Tax=Haloarcula TaxID=2237 RepID=UPI0023E859D8|nr:hypothetical protein [Halomicroarcula sp. SHR3]